MSAAAEASVGATLLGPVRGSRFPWKQFVFTSPETEVAVAVMPLCVPLRVSRPVRRETRRSAQWQRPRDAGLAPTASPRCSATEPISKRDDFLRSAVVCSVDVVVRFSPRSRVPFR